MTQKIRYARQGDRLSAAYVNRIVDASNLAINVLGPARSKRVSSPDSYDVPLDDSGAGTVEGVGTKVYRETRRRISTIELVDPDTDASVDVERIDEVTLATSDGETITLVFDNG